LNRLPAMASALPVRASIIANVVRSQLPAKTLYGTTPALQAAAARLPWGGKGRSLSGTASHEEERPIDALRRLQAKLQVVNSPSKQAPKYKELVKGTYDGLGRDRYKAMGDFVEHMQAPEPEEEQWENLTPREQRRRMRQWEARKHNLSYIVGAFSLGTLLLAVTSRGAWEHTKRQMGVEDAAEYAERMREITPEAMQKLQSEESAVGWGLQRVREGAVGFVHGDAMRELRGVVKSVATDMPMKNKREGGW